MLDIKYIREHSEEVKNSLHKKNVDGALVDRLLEIDEKRRNNLSEYGMLRQKQNVVSEKIVKASSTEKKDMLEAMREVKNRLTEVEKETKDIEEEFAFLMYKLPNIPSPDVPVGADASENRVVREVLPEKKFSFTPRDYIELGEKLDLIDTERAAKVSGARFGYFKHEAPLLEFALVQYVFSRLINRDWISHIVAKRGLNVSQKPFIPLVPPVMIRPDVYRGMGRLDPGQEEERYFLPKDDLYLVGSAEHTTGPMHMGEVFEESALPHRHIAFSTCFRREAGSYGKDTRGILRVHQFDKLEMFSFVESETSDAEHELLVAVQEELMQELKISYRVVFICAGDMGWPDAKQYDIEAWMPGQNEYRETHSASNTTDFQSRRLNIKYKKSATGKAELLHMLNATAFAIGRILIAILENYQEEDGGVRVPDALLPYMHGITRVAPRK